MALSDTQRLVAELELRDKFSGTAGRAARTLGGLEGQLGRTGRSLGVFGHAAGTALGIGLARAVSGGVRLITGAITAGVESLNELENVTTATNTVIASTQGVAGQTAASIRALSEEYEDLNAMMDDKIIQAGANMLLTFTNIRQDAFEPALLAALNLNEAMGAGPGGLQATIIQVGKALNDPIQGIGALRRVGVQLSDEQEEQVKLLMEQNDLYGAQSIILDELTTQFGGRFAAAGATAEGQQAALRDRIEDLQKALAGPLLPVLDRARTKLIQLFELPASVAATTRLGETIAGLFTEQRLTVGFGLVQDGLDAINRFDFDKVGDGVRKVFGFLSEVPWDALAGGLRITGQATKLIVDSFLQLPKEVQGILVAALAINKITGGGLGNLGGSVVGALIGKGIDLFRGRGSTPVNPLFVQQVGGVPGTPGGPGGGKFPLVPVLGALAAPLILSGSDNPTAEMSNRQLELTRQLEEGAITSAEAARLWSEAYGQVTDNPFRVEMGPSLADFVKLTLRPNFSEARNKVTATLPDTAMEPVTTSLASVVSKQDQVAAAIRNQSGVLAQIRDKSAAVTVKVTNNVQVGVSEIQYRIQSLTTSLTGTPTAPSIR